VSESESPKGFKVVDRRGGREPEVPAIAEAPPKDEAPPRDSEAVEARAGATLDFGTFLLSLASSAMIHLGDLPHPEGGTTERNLAQAKQTIDLMALMEEKTKGNLTAEEARFLGSALRDLRLRFVEASRPPV
jgi:Domain of unknown function (DUF1844)